MTLWTRLLLLSMWIGMLALTWHFGWLPAMASALVAVSGLLLLVWPATPLRRRRGALRYVEMAKQPISLQ